MERVDDAMDYLYRSLKICQDNNIGYGEGLTLASLGDGYLALGKPADAHSAWQRAHDILAEIGATEAQAVRERLANLALPARDCAGGSGTRRTSLVAGGGSPGRLVWGMADRSPGPPVKYQRHLVHILLCLP